MQPAEFYQSLRVDKTPLQAVGFNPYYLPLSGLQQGRPRLQGKVYFDLASNDYLGLASDERISEAMVAALSDYGASMCGTPIATGYARLFADLERELARFIGLEAAVIFPSCYQANVALFPAVATPRDIILVDHFAHASLVQGIRAVGCRIKPFLHNDLGHLERQLAASAGFRQSFVVTESVFSTEGSVAPFDGMVELCREYQALPVIDDSHGLGVLGGGGRGILAEKQIRNYLGLYTASLGKALAGLGGLIAGPRSAIDALRYSCPGLIYSTALPPVCLAGVLRAVELLREEHGRLAANMWSNHRRLLNGLRERGLTMATAQAPIAAIQCGSPEATLGLAREFFQAQILATPFVPPSVPPGRGVLRLIVGAKLNPSNMGEALEALHRINPAPTNQSPKAASARGLVNARAEL